MVLELQKPRPIWQIMFSTHHTDVGLLYMITSLAFLFLGGTLALAIRAELFLPGSQMIADSMTFNRMFTVHGTTLIFLFLLPFASAVGNYLVPIMVRYKDMAYPKLNAIAFWMIPPAGALIWLGFADFTWFAAALLMLLTDRLGVSGFFNPAMGGDPIAYAHLFWFTFHPEVYVLVIPAIGMMYEIIPRFSRKPIFSHSSGIFAFVLLSMVSFS